MIPYVGQLGRRAHEQLSTADAYKLLQPSTTCCIPVQHVATQYSILDEPLGPCVSPLGRPPAPSERRLAMRDGRCADKWAAQCRMVQLRCYMRLHLDSEAPFKQRDPVPMWQGRAQSLCRCGRGEPGPKAAPGFGDAIQVVDKLVGERDVGQTAQPGRRLKCALAWAFSDHAFGRERERCLRAHVFVRACSRRWMQ